MKKLNNTKGFTLIEMMIVVAIIGVLAAIAYPSYLESIRKSNRSDAKAELNDVAQRLQRCFTAYSAYNNANCSVYTELNTGTKKIISGEGFYGVTLPVITATTYTLSAAPETGTSQVKDLKCTAFTLTHTGVRAATGSDANNCW